MLTYWETLIATRSNIAVNDSYAQLWGRRLSNAYTVATYTGTLPTTLTGTKAGYLESYKIYGNAAQTGTPTPENPIIPSGCGELETTGVHAGQYKLPLTSAGQNVDIYLGEVQSTRRIKKLVLTGREGTWARSGSANNTFYFNVSGYYRQKVNITICSHYTSQVNINGAAEMQDGNVSFYANASQLSELFYVRDSKFATVADLKSYFQQQYAAGTPVTVWYVLAEPETGIVNEPLMKIGDYADTIDSAQTSAQIPTAAGETTISWAGEGLAPSEVELVYKVKR